MRAGYIMRER